MTSFVESCIETVADSAQALARRSKGRPSAARLLKQLAGKKSILVTTHQHPDPDALASAHAMSILLRAKLPGAKVETSLKGQIAGGINEAFARNSNVQLVPWSDVGLAAYDAILLLDCQPGFSYNPIPAGVPIHAVIDHHRSKKRKPKCPFTDIRTDVGATSSIVFSYFMELEVPISAHLGATLLYAIESDLAGAAGTPGDLDNIALSGLTLIADAKALYKMRYVKLSQSYYTVFAEGLSEALVYEKAIISHLTHIDSFEKPAVMADMFLRYDKAEWSLVTAIHNQRLLLSLRTSNPQLPHLIAADVMAKLVRGLGDGGGHRAKAGGIISLENASEAEVTRLQAKLRQRFLRALGLSKTRGQRLVPNPS
jgi:nanoRNase/pAp phosphatase (c-di-AMP/oligoRNAs hydrolase)